MQGLMLSYHLHTKFDFLDKNIGAQKSAMKPKRGQYSDMKKLGNSDCGGAGLKDHQYLLEDAYDNSIHLPFIHKVKNNTFDHSVQS